MKTSLVIARPGKKTRLSKIDPGGAGGVNKEEALASIEKLREKLQQWQEVFYAEHRRSLLIIFQAMDTGGKDGSVKNLCAGLDPAGLHITSFKAPTAEELDHDFLWRIHRATPGKGMIGIWNRSHYEDVLVARVQKLVEKNVWKARYEQINRFEKHLCENGTTTLKFMLHISKEEQKQRLQARLDDPEKRWKFNPGDIKERGRWDDYQEAYEDAINCCTTNFAPWHIVPADHKWARNLAIIERVVHALKKMGPRYPKLTFDPKEVNFK
ncbi:MAG TPA: polyphosphate kinase 2 family protein [Chthoniobacterales bacterium]|nr:polyphosphate kinase 2 family protein [Chthoniobacterales bacterium]